MAISDFIAYCESNESEEPEFCPAEKGDRLRRYLRFTHGRVIGREKLAYFFNDVSFGINSSRPQIVPVVMVTGNLDVYACDFNLGKSASVSARRTLNEFYLFSAREFGVFPYRTIVSSRSGCNPRVRVSGARIGDLIRAGSP